jgi:uncharacterized protein
MQPSQYLKVYSWDDKPGHLLLFSAKKASKILITQETYEAIQEDTLSPSDEELLLRLGMIVPDREEERKDVLGFFDQINEMNPGLSLMVVLNLDCNFSCVYCYEGEMKGNLYMSHETADLLIGFIRDHFPGDKQTLHIDFYGGEPLLSMGLITYISRALKSFAEGRGASYSFTLVTNGSLFTGKAAEELVPLGLQSVKITLDGPAEVHNQYRPFKSGAGSFDAIIKNIKETCDLVKIGIGGNFEKSTYEKFPLLLDYLLSEGLAPDRISRVKFDPVMKTPDEDLSLPEQRSGCISVNEPWLSDASVQLREEILKRGYATLPLMPITCMVEIKDSYVVNYDGLIYKCPGFIGQKGFEIGDLQTGVKDYTDPYKLGIWKNEDCAHCEYLPLCLGGCRYMSFLRDGGIESVDCQKPYLDASLETLVKQDIQYKLKAEEH